MEPLHLRLLNKYGLPCRLATPDEIEVYFPYENADALCKRMSSGHVKILNAERGELSVELSQFDVNGIPTGFAQNFTIRVFEGSKIREGVFERAFDVRTMNVDGIPRKVIHKR